MGSYRNTLLQCFPEMQFSISPELPTERPSALAKDFYQRLAAAFRVLPTLERDGSENRDQDVLLRFRKGLEFEFVIIFPSISYVDPAELHAPYRSGFVPQLERTFWIAAMTRSAFRLLFMLG